MSTILLYSSRLTPPPHQMCVHLLQLSQQIAAGSSPTHWPHMVHRNSQLATAGLLEPGSGWISPASRTSAVKSSRVPLRFFLTPTDELRKMALLSVRAMSFKPATVNRHLPSHKGAGWSVIGKDKSQESCVHHSHVTWSASPSSPGGIRLRHPSGCSGITCMVWHTHPKWCAIHPLMLVHGTTL